MGYKRCIDEFKPIDLEQMRPPGFLADVTRACEEKHGRVKHGWKQIDRCPVCGSLQKEVEFSKFGIDILRCLECTLRYSSKVPLNTEDVYSDTVYLPSAKKSYLENVSYRKTRFGEERLELIRSHIGSLEGKKILDVGCGTGWFLECAKEHGMDIYGQELGKELRSWTESRIGISIFSSELDNISRDIRFDVITMFDLLEHVPDPIKLLIDSKRLLLPGGVIVVFTPNFDSLSVATMKANSNLIVPAEHLTYFTRKSVNTLARKIRMTIIFYRTCGIDLGDMKSYYEQNEAPYLSTACQRLYEHIQPVVDASGSGNHMRFILKE